MVNSFSVLIAGILISVCFEMINAANNTTCGGTVLSSSVYYNNITSPNYPTGTNNKVSCVWMIKTLPGRQISVEFLDSKLRIGSNRACIDYVKVYDGSSSRSPLLGSVCGTSIPTFVSSGITLRLEYKTAGPSYLSRFNLKYKARTFKVCGDLKLSSAIYNKYISSPGYPLYTTSHVTCAWRIDAEYNKHTTISSVTFALKNTNDCSKSYVKIFDGYDDTAPLLGTWCGSTLPQQQSTGRFIYIEFNTQANVTSRFRLKYWRNGPSSESSHYAEEIGGGVTGALVIVVIVCVIIGVVVRRHRAVPFERFG